MFCVSNVLWMVRVCVVLFLLNFSFLGFSSAEFFRNNFIFLVAKFFSNISGWSIMCIGELG